MSNSIIEIKRLKQYANKARAIQIYINNKKIDTIKDGETKSFQVDPIQNQVYAKIDWCKTKPLKINTKENTITKLELGSNLSGFKLKFALYYVIFKTSEYLYLKKI
ncbi:hypothetical protein [Olleya marilimosa]|uniref:hypothetical protein n=1 Tax=Olleya marilimosa TaxID=272164 RepID=UPI0030EC7526|tara:strand:- start:237955 stop:238272 length:318 start_codon:yes stop_codon:yes gene_type:complete